jgi:hypothetical protein
VVCPDAAITVFRGERPVVKQEQEVSHGA